QKVGLTSTTGKVNPFGPDSKKARDGTARTLQRTLRFGPAVMQAAGIGKVILSCLSISIQCGQAHRCCRCMVQVNHFIGLNGFENSYLDNTLIYESRQPFTVSPSNHKTLPDESPSLQT